MYKKTILALTLLISITTYPLVGPAIRIATQKLTQKANSFSTKIDPKIEESCYEQIVSKTLYEKIVSKALSEIKNAPEELEKTNKLLKKTKRKLRRWRFATAILSKITFGLGSYVIYQNSVYLKTVPFIQDNYDKVLKIINPEKNAINPQENAITVNKNGSAKLQTKNNSTLEQKPENSGQNNQN